MTRQRPSASRRPRVLSALVSVGAYALALYGQPVTPLRILASVCGVFLGVLLPASLWTLVAFLLGRGCGLAPRIVSIGVGPALRTSLGRRRIVIVRRVPVPIVETRVAAVPDGTVKARPVPLLITAFLLQLLVGAALMALASSFAVGAGAACLGVAVLRLRGIRRLMAVTGTVGSDDSLRADAAAAQVVTAVQRSVREARNLIDGWAVPQWRESPAGRMAEVLVLMGEGRYREALTVTEALEQVPGLTASDLPAVRLSRARALAYAMEEGGAAPGDSEAFFALCEELRSASSSLLSGSDLRGLYHLAQGDLDAAIGEAKSATRVGSAPLRRCMSYCTLALALHRAGRGDQARDAIRRAKETGLDAARIAFVEGIVEGVADGVAGGDREIPAVPPGL